MSKKLQIESESQMIQLGKSLASNLVSGDLVVLDGLVGAGKTTLTKGIAQGLDITDQITSPTFVISRVHGSKSGKPDLVHVDAYRLGSITEVDSLDLESSLDDSITIVEWGAGLIEGLTDENWLIKITRDVIVDSETREVEIFPPASRELSI
jgi:tRNA threonylcarbamoyladenosine biosynthesis protein TsaE